MKVQMVSVALVRSAVILPAQRPPSLPMSIDPGLCRAGCIEPCPFRPDTDNEGGDSFGLRRLI